MGGLPDGWRETTLGEVSKFINGRAFKPSEWEEKGKLIIRIQDLTGSINDPHYTTNNYDSKYLVKKGDLLISWSATLDAYIWEREDAWLNQHIFKVDENAEVIEKKFLYYLVRKKIDSIKRFTHGSTMKHITKKNFDSTKIQLPPLSTQKKIADMLEKAEKLKMWRAEADKLTDEFLKSTFVEMFGDPVKNPIGWKIIKLGEIGAVNSGLTLNGKRRENKNNLFPYLRVANVFRNKVDLSEIKKIHVSDNEIERFLLKKNDVLIVEGHGNIEEIGRTAVWKGEISNCVHQNHIIRARLDEKKIISEFLSYFLNMYGNHGYFSSKSNTTSGLNTINTNKIRNANVPLPPLPLQQKFAAIVQQVEQMRQYQQESKAHIDDLFNALMQKAFKGELVA